MVVILNKKKQHCSTKIFYLIALIFCTSLSYSQINLDLKEKQISNWTKGDKKN